MAKKNKKKNNNNVNNEIQEEKKEVVEKVVEEVKEETTEEVKKEVVESNKEVEETTETTKEDVKEETDNTENPPEEKEKKLKFGEKISLAFRKKWIANSIRTTVIAVALILIFIFIQEILAIAELPEFDLTEKKIYTLSDASKEAIKEINKEIKIYGYGYEDKDDEVKLIKQYCKVNSNLSYEKLTPESNYPLIQEYNLTEGYKLFVLQSGDTKRLVDSAEFKTYDFTTFQEIDVTEQTITNSILSMAEENQPKVYFVTGHAEFSVAAEVATFAAYLHNEAMKVEQLQLTNGIPDDCDTLVIMVPGTDYLDSEVQAIIDYVNKGGDLFIAFDAIYSSVPFPNLQKVLDLYGVSVQNGYVVEKTENALTQYPYIFAPEVSSSNKITRDIFTDNLIYLVYAEKLNFLGDSELENLKVKKEVLMSSSDQADFITTTNDIQQAISNTVTGKHDIAALMTKTVNENSEDENQKESKLIIVASGSFLGDFTVTQLDEKQKLFSIASNKDFGINSISTLVGKTNFVTLRKDMGAATYVPTEAQNKVVLSIIFAMPVVIIAIGIIIWAVRKKRK